LILLNSILRKPGVKNLANFKERKKPEDLFGPRKLVSNSRGKFNKSGFGILKFTEEFFKIWAKLF